MRATVTGVSTHLRGVGVSGRGGSVTFDHGVRQRGTQWYVSKVVSARRYVLMY